MTKITTLDLITEVDDEVYDELNELIDQKIVHVNVWEDSLGDELEGRGSTPEEQHAFDVDIYLEDGVYFEMYGTVCYTDLDAEPMAGLDIVAERMNALVKQGVVLGEVAVDDENALVLVLMLGMRPVLYLSVGGWILEEWDELPD